mgnify:CR=1 FL=1
MSNYYSELFAHLVWHTKESLPLLRGEVEDCAHKSIRKRCVEERGVFVYQIGGTDNHVHLCVSYPPTLTLSTFIGQLKGLSSHETNTRTGRREADLQWQTGYGVVSFGKGDLKWVMKYIENQRTHHAEQTSQLRLERITNDDA